MKVKIWDFSWKSQNSQILTVIFQYWNLQTEVDYLQSFSEETRLPSLSLLTDHNSLGDKGASTACIIAIWQLAFATWKERRN